MMQREKNVAIEPRVYKQVPREAKAKLLRLVLEDGANIVDAAKITGINYGNAKAIMLKQKRVRNS